MTFLLGPILAAVLGAAQGPPQAAVTRTVTGEVVDGQGRPVADARVVFYAPPDRTLKTGPVELQTGTGNDGKFSLVRPALGPRINTAAFVAYSPGRAIGTYTTRRPPIDSFSKNLVREP